MHPFVVRGAQQRQPRPHGVGSGRRRLAAARRELIRPGGRVANIGVHGHPVTLHLEKLWIRDVTITMGLVDANTTDRLLRDILWLPMNALQAGGALVASPAADMPT